MMYRPIIISRRQHYYEWLKCRDLFNISASKGRFDQHQVDVSSALSPPACVLYVCPVHSISQQVARPRKSSVFPAQSPASQAQQQHQHRVPLFVAAKWPPSIMPITGRLLTWKAGSVRVLHHCSPSAPSVKDVIKFSWRHLWLSMARLLIWARTVYDKR